MKNSIVAFARISAASIVACAIAASAGQPAAAQTAKKLKCNGCVSSKHIKNGAIKGADIRNNTISGAQLQDNAITSGKIVDGQVGSPDLANNAVTSGKIADGQVGTDDLAAGAVTSVKIEVGAVGGTEVAAESVGSADLSNEAGAGFAGGLQSHALTGGAETLRSVMLTAPSNGVVIANASGFFVFDDDNGDLVRCSVTTGTTIDLNNLIVAEDRGDAVKVMPFAGTRGFVVTPGSITFNLVCEEGDGDVTVEDSQLTALFVPTMY